jgi:PKD repeat protein
MATYYVDLSVANDGAHAGTLVSPFSYADLQLHSAEHDGGNIYHVKGMRDVDIVDGTTIRYWDDNEGEWKTMWADWRYEPSVRNNTWTSWQGEDPWRINVFNSNHLSDDFVIYTYVGSNDGTCSNGLLNVRQGNYTYNNHLANMTLGGSDATFSIWGSTYNGSTFNLATWVGADITATYNDCLFLGSITIQDAHNSITFNNCAFTALNTLDPAQIVDNNNQWGWSAPTWPAWDAPISSFSDSLTSAVSHPPQPGNSPYSGYDVGYKDTSRTGIGALYFTPDRILRDYPQFLLADFHADVLFGNAPLTVTFTNDTSGWPGIDASVISHYWAFGDGQFSSSYNPVNTYTQGGVFTVSLRESRNYVTSDQTLIGYITVNDVEGVRKQMRPLNQVYKTGILTLEECQVTAGVSVAGTSLHVAGAYMSPTPFEENTAYTIYDSTWATSQIPNAERFLLSAIDSSTVTPRSDGVGYDYTATFTILGDTTDGWSGGFHNNYTLDSTAMVLTPGKEVVIKSADFNCRFRTMSDTPKVDFDDESARFAIGDEGRDIAIPGLRTGEINFTQKLSWGGAVGVIPKWDKIMRSVGHWRRINGAFGIEYLPHTWSNEVTATVWILNPENGEAPMTTVYRYKGCHGGNGSGISVGKIGDPYTLTCKYSGAFVGTSEFAPSQVRVLTASDMTVPEVMLNTLCLIPGPVSQLSVQISQFNLDFGGVVNPFIDQYNPSGVAWFATQDKEPKFTCNPYMVKKSDDDIDAVVSGALIGTVMLASSMPNPHLTIAIPNAQLLSPTYGSREGYISTERTYRALRNDLGEGAVDVTIPDQCMYTVILGSKA